MATASLSSCAEKDFRPSKSDEKCKAGETRCKDGAFESCAENGLWRLEKLCAEACDDSLGCVECVPNSTACDGNDGLLCNADGTWSIHERCEAKEGDTCVSGRCENACEAAAAANSYIGCEYWPTVTLNQYLGALGGEFDFAVVVANPNPAPTDVTVRRGDDVEKTLSLASGEVATITLPWVPELVQSSFLGYAKTPRSVHVPDGAYRLTSTLPVTAYQFNPLQFEAKGFTCGGFGGSGCSYTNDASLLLPSSALDPPYIVIARPSLQVNSVPVSGFFSVVAIEDDTTAIVRFSAHTLAGPGDGLLAYSPGETATFSLDGGDVLQMLSASDFEPVTCDSVGVGTSCLGGPEVDLTGTRVDADKAIAVFGGHDCTFVPYDAWCCDHNEEQIYPLATWGSDLLAVSTIPQVENEPNVWKIVSGSAANEIVFEPDVHESVVLDESEYFEFEYQGAFRVTGSGRVAVAQFMVGEDYNGYLEPPGAGDPAMAMVVPFEQFRTSYDFLTPDTYTSSYVNVIAPLSGAPELDGGPLPKLEPIGSTGFGFARAQVKPGTHRIESIVDPQPFGITVSGIAPYTSYMYAGGLNLKKLNIQ